MATPAPESRTSSIPIFTARLRTLQALASGLNELPQPSRTELESFLKQAERVIQNSLGPIPPETDSEGNGILGFLLAFHESPGHERGAYLQMYR